MSEEITQLKAKLLKFEGMTFSENEALKLALEALELVKIQTTCAEYFDECGDSIDGQTCMEAWDSLLLEIRKRLAEIRKLRGEG